MLGRQQIAGIPTAISELFKNAHDAYADHAEVDFWRADGLLVLRDDGVGMSRDDFQRRWLTLGTESKVGAGGLARPPVDPSKGRRPVLGEKGIGRLAIAAVGPQVLVLTRAMKQAVSGDAASGDELVAALIHWGFFQLPGVDLDEIDVPLLTLPDGLLPDAACVARLTADARANLDALGDRVGADDRRRIAADLDAFAVDPRALDAELNAGPGGPSLAGGGHGTHFYVFPTDESLVPAIDGRGEGRGQEDVAPPLLKTLIGFTNTMTPGHVPPAIRTAFRDHKASGVIDDLIEDRAFFTPQEFENADHHITGSFDAFGQFAGTVTVYGEATRDHIVPWTEARGAPTDCGPFRVSVATVQGRGSESTLPPDEWAQMIAKMNRIGGLYIYRDGIRVLPYGNNEYDFLDIEQNRSKSASDNYFSYRRMFGVIEIASAANRALVEKAGREGFRENKAYRQFRDVLKSFFRQIAADFFRETATHGDRYNQHRAELARLDAVRKRHETLARSRRREFQQRLEQVGDKLAAGEPARAADGVVVALRRELAAVGAVRDPDRRASALLDAESNARRALEKLRDDYRVSAPRGVGLPLRLRRDFDGYRADLAQTDTAVFAPTLATVEQLVGESAAHARADMDRRVRFERALAEVALTVQRGTVAASRAVTEAAERVKTEVAALARSSVADVDRVVNDVLSRAARLDVSRLPDAGFVTERTQLEDELRAAAEAQRSRLDTVADRLRGIGSSAGGAGADPAGDAPGAGEVVEALEDEVLALRERTDDDLELVQMGMAIQVVNHEFDTTVRAVRTGVRELRAWADANPALEPVYTSIRRNFEHLDSYLTFFTPLQRRLYRTAVDFTGGEIARFLAELFRDRLQAGDTVLESTRAFGSVALTGYPSSFYPVFVNLVDNALHWVQRAPAPRRIRLEGHGSTMVVANTGPAIAEADRDVIFERGFSRRAGGRGLGLYIARRVLEREGYTVRVAARPPRGYGAAVEILPADAEGTDEEGLDSVERDARAADPRGADA